MWGREAKHDLDTERRFERIEAALRLIARHVIKDENELRALLKAIAAPHNALSATTVTVVKP